MDGQQHVGLEASGLHLQPSPSEHLEGTFEHRRGLVGRSRIGEAGTASAPGVAVKSGLADNQKLGPDIQGRAIELASVVREDAEVDGLVDDVAGGLLVVFAANAHQHHQPRPDAAQRLGAGYDRGASDPLHDGAQ